MSSNGINTIWTDPLLETLRRGWKLCLSGKNIASMIATEHGVAVSRNAVIGKMARLGLQGRIAKPKMESRKKIAAYQKRSWPRMEIPRPCPAPRNDEVTATSVHILDLEPHHCRLVIGEPKDGMFCGREKVPGLSYCADHAQRVFLPPRLVIRRESRERVLA